MEASVLTSLSEADPVVPEWDDLAIATGTPFSAPGWLLPWWTRVAPEGAGLAVVVVSDAGRVVGIGPFFEDRRSRIPRIRLLGSGTSLRVAPLAHPGLEQPVAAAMASVLTGSTRLMSLEGMSSSPPWARLLAGGWGDGARIRREWTMPAPVLHLGGSSYEEWFATRSSNFRQQMRRDRRKLEQAGATFRLTAPDEVEADIASFVRLHRSRWADRGGSATVDRSVATLLAEATPALISAGRLRLWNVDIEGEVVSSHLFLQAGTEVSYWLGGFDDGWAPFRPGIQVLLKAIEHAWSCGDDRFDLGPGGHDYKFRFTDDHDTVEWWSLVPRGVGSLRTSISLVPGRARWRIASKLPPGIKTRLKTAYRVTRGR